MSRRAVPFCLLAVVALIPACGEGSSPTTPSAAPGPGLAGLSVEASVVGGQRARGTASLNAPAPPSGVVVTLTANNAAVTVPASITIPSGATTADFEVTTTLVPRTTDVAITAQAADVRHTASIRLRIDPATVRPSASFTIGFSGLHENGVAFSTYNESGFTISPISGGWMAVTTFGRPGPFIQFMSNAGVTTTGEIRVTAEGRPFWLTSVDFYSSTTRIPYVIEGFLGSDTPAFTLTAVLGNTFGNFARVSGPAPDTPVDLLVIRLSNPAAPCCSNPMGVDNIILRR